MAGGPAHLRGPAQLFADVLPLPTPGGPDIVPTDPIDPTDVISARADSDPATNENTTLPSPGTWSPPGPPAPADRASAGPPGEGTSMTA